MKRTASSRLYSNLVTMLAILVVSTAWGQEKEHAHTLDAKAEVPALKTFHTVIYQLWHNAWPNKDYTTLVKLLPDIEKHTAEVAAAKLPGVFHEKQEAWDNGVKALQQIVGEYKTAVEKKENQKLLDAAEKLHNQYEKLVQVTRPVLREISDFHESLYMLYHHYLPEYDLEKIRTSVSELQTKMAALNKAVLPEHVKTKAPAFDDARKKLDASVSALAASLPSNDETKIKAAIEMMHGDYEMLQELFE